jgi:hypothetical protein
VEAEDAALAEGLVRGAVRAGSPPAELQEWLYGVVADHFLDFGHPLIYQNKLYDLLALGNWEHTDALLGGHVFGIVNGTREDVLPAWSGYRRRLAGLDLGALDRRPRTGALDSHALVSGRPGEVLERVLESDAPFDQLLAALAEAAAQRFLRFDVSLVYDEGVQDDWLDITHRLTVAEAVWTACDRWASAERWKLVLQLAWFVARAAPYDGVVETPTAGGDLRRSILGGDAAGAMGAVAAGEVEALRGVFMDLCLEDRAVRPIVIAHRMKTTLAAFQLHARTGSRTPLAALARWFASPGRERWSTRRVREAIRLVTEGKPPVRRVE